MGNVLVGTASWTDKSLIQCGRFYPKGCTSAEARLRYYAEHFPIVEVDSAYYAMPSEKNSALWAERTPPNFVMNVKAFRTLTQHQTPRVALPPDLRDLIPGTSANVYAKDLPREVIDELWARYRRALQPLATAGKLGVLHFQFPHWFQARRESYAYLDEVRERVADYTLAVEFRHQSWFAGDQRDATLKFKQDRRIVNVIVDEPQGDAKSIPSVWERTHPQLALVRLHGRNQATWSEKGLTASSERFNYDYTREELADLASSIRAMAADSVAVQVILNNNLEDQGVRNGRTMMELLEDIAVPAEREEGPWQGELVAGDANAGS